MLNMDLKVKNQHTHLSLWQSKLNLLMYFLPFLVVGCDPCDPPMKLGRWTRNVRWSVERMRKGLKGNIRLNDAQIKLLNDIDFDISVTTLPLIKSKNVVEMYTKEIGLLSKFIAEFGHTSVSDDHELASWMTDMRKKKNEGTLDPELELVLNRMGVQLVVLSFAEGLSQYCAVKENGQEIKKHTPLYFWCKDIRGKCTEKNAGTMKKNSWYILKAINFDFGNSDSIPETEGNIPVN